MNKNPAYIIGLDLGVSSIGWCAIEIDDQNVEVHHKRLIDVGVRIFESAVDNDGKTAAAIRRGARSTRKRLRRRRHRLKRIKDYLIRSGLIDNLEDLELLKNEDPYRLRYQALNELLTKGELARVLLHLSKRRGFKSNRKNIDKDEGGGKEYGVAVKNMRETAEKHRTVGEALYLAPMFLNTAAIEDENTLDEEKLDPTKYGHQKRNRRGNYLAVFTRDQIEDEIRKILATQRKLGNQIITTEFEKEFISIWSAQRHYFDPDKISKLVGICSIFNTRNGYQEDLYRAPSGSYGYHFLRSLQSLLNYIKKDSQTGKYYISLRHKETHKWSRLEIEEIEELIEHVHQSYIIQFKDFKTNHLREFLNIDQKQALPGEYPKKKNVGKDKDTKKDIYELDLGKDGLPKYEAKTIFSGNSYLKSFNSAFQKYYPALQDAIGINYQLLDECFLVNLTKYRDEERLQAGISKSLIENAIDFDKKKLQQLVENLETKEKYGDLSLKAIWEIVPQLSTGINTSNAIDKTKKKYHLDAQTTKSILLTPIDDPTLTNPRVKRVLSETRKIINALVRKYGSPTFVNIELGRDLKNGEETRNQISRHNSKLRKRRERVMQILIKEFGITKPSKQDIQRYILWEDQKGKCLLSREAIPADKLFTNTEIDHAIPWSRIADDSYLNRILVSKKVNQEKSNKTPFEYFNKDLNSADWKQYVNYVNSLDIAGRKKAKLVSTEVETGFAERQLNEMRYTSRYIKNYIENNLVFRDFDKKSRVVTVNGRVTAIVRKFYYDFAKDRNNDRHHAMDAVIAAITTRSLIKKLNDYAKTRKFRVQDFDEDLQKIKEEAPKPWENFYGDIHNRIFAEKNEFKVYLEKADTKKRYGDIMGLVKPLFVSRAPVRKVTGTAHADTVYRLEGEDNKGKKVLSVRKPLDKFSLAKEKTFQFYKDDPTYIKRVEPLTLRQKEQAATGKLLVTKDNSDGPKTKIVSTKVPSASNSAKPISRGNHTAWVESGQSMVRVDVFEKEGKHYLVPIYVYDTIKQELPNRAVVDGRARKDWPIMDDSYNFRFSLYKNDYIRLKRNGSSEIEEGYYIKIHSKSGALIFQKQDGSGVEKKGKLDKDISAGARTLDMLEKYNVDPLGGLHKVKQEKRLPFKLKYKKRNGL